MIPLRAYLAFTLALAGCGGKVVFDESQGGSGGTGPSTTSSASSKSTSVGTSVGTSVVASSSGTGGIGDCSALGYRGIGSPCPMHEGQTCTVAHSCCGVQATCVAGAWTVTGGPLCDQPCLACGGGLECNTNSICVLGQPDLGGSWFDCQPNSCSGQPLACTCAQPACAAMFLQCSGPASATTIICDCPNC